MRSAAKLVVGLAILLVSFSAVMAQNGGLTDRDLKLFSEFDRRTKDYVKVRNEAIKGVPKLSVNSSPEQIESFKKSMQNALAYARRNADLGDILDRSMYSLMRRLILTEFSGFKASALRREVLAAANKGVKLRVNAEYPETEELVMMPPTLLLTLPKVPPELRYRFVGRALLLIDRDTGLIADFMPNALP